MTKTMRSRVNACFKNTMSTYFDGFFPVKDKSLESWLTKNAAITTDSGITEFPNDGFRARFCWVTQKWMVGA